LRPSLTLFRYPANEELSTFRVACGPFLHRGNRDWTLFGLPNLPKRQRDRLLFPPGIREKQHNRFLSVLGRALNASHHVVWGRNDILVRLQNDIAARDPSSGSFAVRVNLRHDDAVEPFLDAEFVFQALAQRGECEPEQFLSARTSCAAGEEIGWTASSQRTGSVRPIAGKNHLQSRSSARAGTARIPKAAKT